jgi:hypothetical protein
MTVTVSDIQNSESFNTIGRYGGSCFGGCFGVGGFSSTVYNAVPSRDRAVTETTRVLQKLFRSDLVKKLFRRNNSHVVSV